MKLDPSLQNVLLELAQTERNMKASPDALVTVEQQELDRLIDEQRRLRSASAAAQMAVDDMENEILRIQEDERKLRRRERDNREQLQVETDRERRKDLEYDSYAAKSRIADLMSELKEAHNEIAALRNNRDVHGARVDEMERAIEVAQRAADAANEAASHLDNPEEHLASLRAQLPDAVMHTYEEQKTENDVGAAFFNGRTCGSCFLMPAPTERAAIAKTPADELPQCPNCGSFLVRKQD